MGGGGHSWHIRKKIGPTSFSWWAAWPPSGPPIPPGCFEWDPEDANKHYSV
ncbi:Hypothetical protein FKW44_023362 [Caligus rogercresseyi]|uniref:Uncharacterized protein n=1 Tax=Caligus rogercresseyi TaxID=217165 RepID=A0A7T8GNV7_CALRO|nr:Hypothetical protein FKW44_023362 [Caligus rogercresseyi]